MPAYDDISERFPGSPPHAGAFPAGEPDLALPALKPNGLRPQPELACRHAAAAARHAAAAARHANAAAKLAGLRLPSNDGARRLTKQRARSTLTLPSNAPSLLKLSSCQPVRAAAFYCGACPACYWTGMHAHEGGPYRGQADQCSRQSVDGGFHVRAAHGLLSTTMMEEGMHSPSSTIDNLLFEP